MTEVVKAASSLSYRREISPDLFREGTMKRKLSKLSFLSIMLLCVASGFLALFVGSVLFSQVQAGSSVATATAIPASKTLALTPDQAQLGMTVIPPVSPNSDDSAPMVSATPGLAPLGTMS